MAVGCNKIAACPSRHNRLAGWYHDCGLTGPEMATSGNLTKPLQNKYLLLLVPAFMNHTAHAKLTTQNCPRKTAHSKLPTHRFVALSASPDLRISASLYNCVDRLHTRIVSTEKKRRRRRRNMNVILTFLLLRELLLLLLSTMFQTFAIEIHNW